MAAKNSEPDFGTVDRKILWEQIAEQLLAILKERQLRSGNQLLPGQELAAIMQASRPSLREALHALTMMNVPNPHDLRIRCWVNGELRQDSNTREQVFNVPQLVAYISRTCTLMPGDIISTGTPGGVGVYREPPVFLKPGDVVEVKMEKLGRLRNRVR